jgi:hypothetical protein
MDKRDLDVQDEYVLWVSLLMEHGRYELAQIIAREQLLRTAQYVDALNATYREAAAIAEAESDVEWLQAS